MSRDDHAYMSTDDKVLDAWRKFLHDSEVVRVKRGALSDQYGRNLYVSNSGFGHGTGVTGFERFESDKDGDLLADGALIVSSKRGAHGGLIVPNLRRKAGKAFVVHLREYDTPSLDLPGMPAFHIGSTGHGLAALAPAMFEHEGAVFALWPCEAPVETPRPWRHIALSTYYAADEDRKAATMEVQP